MLSIEAANPRYEHEWNVFEEVHLPEGKILIPGLIDTCSTYLEHPEVVAQRLVRFASRETVIAGTDCGFGTYVGASNVVPGLAWAKLQSLTEGAGWPRRNSGDPSLRKALERTFISQGFKAYTS